MLTYGGDPNWVCLFDKQDFVTAIPSVCGVRQGSVLGPILFAVAVHVVLVSIATAFPDVTVIAYLDDINLFGASCLLAFVALEAALAKIGLRVHRKARADDTETKSKTFWMGNIATDAEGRKILACLDHIAEAAKVLGGCIVAADADERRITEAWLRARIGKQAGFFARLLGAECPVKARLMLLRVCGLPRMNFLMRTHDPNASASACEWFDDEVLKCFQSVMTLAGKPLEPAADCLYKLPLRCGGMGFRRSVETRVDAFEAAVTAITDPKLAKGLQKLKTDRRENKLHKDLLARLPEEEVAIVLSSAEGSRIITDAAIMPNDAAFILAVKERLLIRILPGLCVCGKEATNKHVNTCPHLQGGWKIHRHNNGMEATGMGLQRLDLACTLEPRKLQAEPGKTRVRPDVLVIGGPRKATGDFTCVYPGADCYLPGAARKSMHAAAVKAKEKDDVWAAWASKQGMLWAALAVETTGAVSDDFRTWLHTLVDEREGALTITSAYDAIIADVLTEVLEGTANLYASAQGRAPRNTQDGSTSNRMCLRLQPASATQHQQFFPRGTVLDGEAE